MTDIKADAIMMLRALAFDLETSEETLTLNGLAEKLENMALGMLMLMPEDMRTQVLADWPGGSSPVLRYQP